MIDFNHDGNLGVVDFNYGKVMGECQSRQSYSVFQQSAIIKDHLNFSFIFGKDHDLDSSAANTVWK